MTFLQSLILGIVQGLTEYLPISSSAHLVLVPYLFNWSFPAAQIFPFDVLVQLGTLLAVILYFWKDLVSILKAFFKGLIDKEPFKDPQARLGWYLILATIPAALVGMLIKAQVEAAFSSPRLVAYFLFGTATLLILSDLVGKRTRQVEEMTWWDALWIGLFQAISVFPGISRSGATITGGMTHNFDRSNSARFSFLMSIPVMIGAGLVSIKDLVAVPDLAGFLPVLVVGFVAAMIVGYLSIHWLLSFIKRRKLWYFAVYCILLASTVLLISSIRTAPVQASQTPTVAANTPGINPVTPVNVNLQIINLQYSDSLSWLVPAMTSCANLLQNTGLVTHNLPAEELSLQNSDLNLRWGAPIALSEPSYQIGTARLVLAVNTASALQSLTLDIARQIFSGEITTWGALHTACPDCLNASYDDSFSAKQIALNFYPKSEDIQEIFIQKIMVDQPVATASAQMIPDPAAMRETLSGDSAAIGYLPDHLLDASLREISIDGMDPADLRLPILAITPGTPQGKTLEWLICLQKVLNP